MKATCYWPAVLILAFTAGAAGAKNVSVGIYALIDQVTLEPDGPAPDSIRICGMLIVPRPMSSGEYLPPQRGCLYFRIRSGVEDAARKEWTALQSEAATGHVIAFARYWERNPSDPSPNGYRSLEVTVYAKGQTPSKATYPVPHADGVLRNGGPHDPDFDRIAAELRAAAGVTPTEGH